MDIVIENNETGSKVEVEADMDSWKYIVGSQGK